MMKGKFDRSRSLNELREILNINKLDISPLTVTRSEDYYLLVNDPAPGSSFYFAITGIDFQQGTKYKIQFKPGSINSNGVTVTDVEPARFRHFFDKWLNLVDEYSALLNDGLQESILEGYEDEFSDFFELVDEDADTHSFEEQRQQDIDTLLQAVYNRLRKYREEASLSEDVAREVDTLLADIERLRETQNRQTKRQVVNRLQNIYARFRKAVPSYARMIGSEIVKGLLTDGAKDIFKGFLE